MPFGPVEMTFSYHFYLHEWERQGGLLGIPAQFDCRWLRQNGANQAKWSAMFLTGLRSLAFVVGLLAYYVAFFMFEDQEGKWQNRIEDALEGLWVAVDDKATGKRTAALFGKVAAIVTRTFDRLFGRKLLSFQFVGVSLCYSLAVLFLVCSLALLILQRKPSAFSLPPPPPDLMERLPFLVAFCLITGIVFTMLGALPSIFPSRWSVALSMFPILLFGACFAIIIGTHQLTQKRLAFAIGMILSLLSDVFLIALIRFAVRWVLAKTSALRTVVTLLIQLSVVHFLVLVPVVGIPATIPIEDVQESALLQTLTLMGTLNFFTGIVSSMFIFVLLFVLLHRVTWPILGKLIYPLHRFKVIRNRKLMASFGTACLVFACPAITHGIKTVFSWF